jgi:hypothetical protein
MTCPDLFQIQQYWDSVRTPGETVELRYPATYVDKKTGQVKNCKNTTRCASPEELAAAVTRLGPQLKYWVNLQRMKQDTPHSKYKALKDVDIESYRWLPIDYDLKHPGEGSASEIEKNFARSGANAIYEYFKSIGVASVVIDSGSGFYILPPIDLANTPENVKLITQALAGLKAKFYRASAGLIAKVDSTARNAARVFGLPGTMNPKGPDTPERPHRMRLMLRKGSRDTLLKVAHLEEMASWAPKPARPSSVAPDSTGKKGLFTFDNVENLLEAIAKRTASFTFEQAVTDPQFGPGFYVRCPHDSHHSHPGEDLDSSTCVWVNERGFADFCCLHDGADNDPCRELGWHEFVALLQAEDLQRDFITNINRPGFGTGVGISDDDFQFPRVEGGKVSDYLLLPAQCAFDGWCGRGRTHIIAGSSGSGKTTLMVPLLLGQWEEKTFFGHAGAGLRPLVLFADRGKLSNEETLLRLGLTDSSLPIDHLGEGLDDGALTEILNRIEARNPLPEVVFIEGADTLVTKPADGAVVSRFMKGIEKIAEHYHISFILSVGAPKSKPKDQHTLVRDRVFGSEKWVRKADMVLSLSAAGDGTLKQRHLVVQYRNAADEKFDLEFVNGKLVESAPSREKLDALELWMLDRDWFVRRDAVSAMKDYSGMSRANVNKRIREMFLAGKLETRPSNDKKVEELRIKRGPESNTPEAGEMQRDMAAAFGGNTRADVPDRDGDDTEQALREIYKDLDPEKRERMIQGVLGTEVRA